MTPSETRAVALVCMPWSSIAKPSLALAILKRCVQDAGFSAHLFYLNIRMAERLGIPLYERLTEASFFHPEWFFSQELFGAKGLGQIRNSWEDLQASEEGRRLADRLKRIALESEETCTRLAEEEVPRFIESCMAEEDWGRFTVVGFTTTFGQSLASLLLAKRIKEKYPHVKIVFGGANVDSEMGVEFMRGFPWIDYVVHGEAEKSFPALLKNIGSGMFEDKVLGVSMRSGGECVPGDGNAGMIVDLNESPTPDYSDYIGQLERSGFRKKLQLQLFYESSRGCWWGAKHHCTFCGLNGTTMMFRKKDAAKVYEEIIELADRYRCLTLAATDNILAMDYIGQLLPRLAAMDTDIQLFYEVKANLGWEQLKVLAAGGVNTIQPGIESFNSRVLQLMRKGVTAIQNIQLVKWCYELDIDPGYNVLYGFPGETPEDYRDLPRIFRLLAHLRPPKSMARVMYERFSPYFFDRDKFGLQLRPLSGYEFIFPGSKVDLNKIAYFFEGEWQGQKDDPEEYIHPSWRAWEVWTQQWEEQNVFCFYRKGPDYLVIYDNRPRSSTAAATTRKIHLNEELSAIYLYCDENRSFQSIYQLVDAKFGGAFSEETVRGWLDQLVAQNLMFREGNRYLSLAVRRKPAPKRNQPALDFIPGAEKEEAIAEPQLTQCAGTHPSQGHSVSPPADRTAPGQAP
jgi:ribosomal peptide maturation radical SAM protein 1